MQPAESHIFGTSRNPTNKPSTSKDAKVTNLFTKSEILDKMNTPPEVLLMELILCLNKLTSQILGMLGLQARYRLRPESGPEAIILRFPTVCIIGFIPYLLILIEIILCDCIYSLALFLCFLSLLDDGTRPQSLFYRFRMTRKDMQANAQLTNIRLDIQ